MKILKLNKRTNHIFADTCLSKNQYTRNLVVSAQPNSTLVGVTTLLVCNPPPTPQQTFRPLPDNLGSRFSVYNLILTQLDKICKKNWGAIQKNKKIIRPLPDNLGS